MATSNLSRCGESTDFTDTASSEIKDIAVRAARACFLDFAGIDIMTTSIENGNRTNSFILEINASPGIRMHQSPTNGQQRDIAATIFDYLEQQNLAR